MTFQDIYPNLELDMWKHIPATIIADADNYYTKPQVDSLIHQNSGITSGDVMQEISAFTYTKEEIDDKDAQKLDITAFSAYSGTVASELSEKASESDLNALEGTFSAFSATVAAEIQELEASGMTSGAVQDMLTAYTYDKATIDANDAQKLDITAFSAYSGTVASELETKLSESDFQTYSGQVSNDIINLQNEIQEIVASGVTSGAVQDMLTAYTYSKQEIEDADAQKLDITAFSAYSGTVASELSGKAAESDLEALEGTFSAFSATIETVITSGGGVVSSSDCQTMIDSSISGKTNESDFSAHTADTTVHITADERTAWDSKPNVWIGTQSQWAAISGSTENGTIYLVY